MFNILRALSLALSVATAVLWARSFGRVDACWISDNLGWQLRSDAGTLQWWSYLVTTLVNVDQDGHPVVQKSRNVTRFRPIFASSLNHPQWRPMQTSYVKTVTIRTFRDGSTVEAGVRADIVAVPHWIVLLVVAAPTYAWLFITIRRRESRRRLNAGLCLACGYDLRASTDRCPECGSPIEKDATSAETNAHSG